MTERILSTYKTKVERMVLVPSDGGRFELSVNGAPVFSKLEQGRFPEWSEIEPLLAKVP